MKATVHLRSLTSIEMSLYPFYYANHPLLYGQFLNGKALDENTVFSNLISQNAFNKFLKDNRILAAKVTATNFAHSSFLFIGIIQCCWHDY